MLITKDETLQMRDSSSNCQLHVLISPRLKTKSVLIKIVLSLRIAVVLMVVSENYLSKLETLLKKKNMFDNYLEIQIDFLPKKFSCH